MCCFADVIVALWLQQTMQKRKKTRGALCEVKACSPVRTISASAEPAAQYTPRTGILHCNESEESHGCSPVRSRKVSKRTFGLAAAEASLFCIRGIMRTAVQRVQVAYNERIEADDIQTFLACSLCAYAELLGDHGYLSAGEHRDHLRLGFLESSWENEARCPMRAIDILFCDPDGVLSLSIQLAASGGMESSVGDGCYGGSRALESRLRIAALLLLSQKTKTEQDFQNGASILSRMCRVSAMLCGHSCVSGQLEHKCAERIVLEERRALELPLLAAELGNPVERAEFLLWEHCPGELVHIAIGTLFSTYCASLFCGARPEPSTFGLPPATNCGGDMFARVLAGLAVCSAHAVARSGRKRSWPFCAESEAAAKALLRSATGGCLVLTDTGKLLLDTL